MGLFGSSSKMKFKLLPSTPEQTEARSYLMDLMNTDLVFPEQQIADLTSSEQTIQGQVQNYLMDVPQDYETAAGFYRDILGGKYDPNSQYFEPFRSESERLKGEAQAQVRRTAQKAGVARSTPSLNIEQRTGQQYDEAFLQWLYNEYNNSLARKAGAAQGITNLRGQQISQLSAAEQVAQTERDVQQAKLNAAYNKVLQDMLGDYQYKAEIASTLLNEQRYVGAMTGGGSSPLLGGAMGAFAGYALMGWPGAILGGVAGSMA